VLWAVTVENGSPFVFVENGWVKSTAFGSIIVDGASLTVVKDASPIQILESYLSILLCNEEFFSEAKASYPFDI